MEAVERGAPLKTQLEQADSRDTLESAQREHLKMPATADSTVKEDECDEDDGETFADAMFGGTADLQRREAPSAVGASGGDELPTLRRSEVAKHNSRDDIWVIIGHEVFDLTSFLATHPGGTAPIRYAGGDVTKIFHSVHPKGTFAEHAGRLRVGTLHPDDMTSDGGDAPAADGRRSYYDAAADPEGYDVRKGGEDAREFGDHMSREGDTSHISTIIIVMYAALASWSWLTSVVTGCSVWTVPLFYMGP